MTCPTCEIATLVELLERKGILTKQEVLAMIQELRQREPMAMEVLHTINVVMLGKEIGQPLLASPSRVTPGLF